MEVKLFGKLFKYTFLFLIAIELLSLFATIVPAASQVLFFIILLAGLIISLVKLEYGLYIILAELFVGGKGHLFSLDFDGTTISIRIALFLIILAIWLAKKIKLKELPNFKILIPFYLLFIAILLGAIQGFYNNEFSKLFFDFNGWIYFALAPIFFDLIKGQKVINNILQILTASTTYLALKTIGILILFAHNITGIGGMFYKWVRDSGVGEITYMSGTVFRVFLQSQIYILIGLLIVLFIFISYKHQLNKKLSAHILLYLYLTSLALMISQSRSYWVGAILGLITLFLVAYFISKTKLKKLFIVGLLLIAMVWSQIFLIQLITLNFEGNLISQRFANLNSEAAGISRVNQIAPLNAGILESSFLGHGFGKELTYISTDPRIVQQYPGGIYTTYAFEWGYLDIWLKLGLFGLGAYFLLLLFLISGAIKNPKPVQLGMLVALVALLATNIFSPYLNHPLGIGYILLMAATVKN